MLWSTGFCHLSDACACPNRVSHKPGDKATDDRQGLAMTEFPNWRSSEPFPLHIQIDYLSHRKSVFAFCMCYIGLLLLFGYGVVWLDSHFWVPTPDGKQMAASQYLLTWGGTHVAAQLLLCIVEMLVSCHPAHQPLLLLPRLPFRPMSRRFSWFLWIFFLKFCNFRLCILTLGSTWSWVLYVSFTLLCGYLVFPTLATEEASLFNEGALSCFVRDESTTDARDDSELPVICTPFSHLSHTVVVTYAQIRNCRVSLYPFCSRFWALQSCVFYLIKNSTGLSGGLHWDNWG